MSSRIMRQLGLWAVVAVAVALSAAAFASGMTLQESEVVPSESGRATASTVWFQGFLADSSTGDPINATYNIVARIYDLAAGGVVLWGPETHNSVAITEGWFNIELGATLALLAFDDPPYYLSLQVNGETLSPRLKLASVPSALHTATSDLLPFDGTYNGTDDAMEVAAIGAGAGDALWLSRESGAGAAFALYARNSGPEAVIRGWQNASSATTEASVLLAEIAVNANDSPVIDAFTTGAGAAYYGATDGPYGVEVYADGSDVATTEDVHVVHAVYDGVARTGEVVGVYGDAVVSDEWGIGGQFYGSGVGVQGISTPDADGLLIFPGVYGIATTTNVGENVGVWGSASNGGANYGGLFDGDVDVNGTLTKSGGSFKIDHPLDPANKYLSHSFVESPDMKNVYDGVVTLDAAGEAMVEMPEWFEALNQDFRYQLTAIGAPGPNLYIASEVSGNSFRIAGGEAGMKVSWQVTGIRHDKWAEAHRIPVEEAKPARELGTYRDPAVYGLPESAQIRYDARNALGHAGHRTTGRRPEPAPVDGVDPEDR